MFVRSCLGIFFILILLEAVPVVGQEWEVGVSGGTSGYMGDLNPENPFAYNDWAAGLFVRYNLSGTWGIRGNLSYANIHADDAQSPVASRRERGLNFMGQVIEGAVLMDFNFFRFLPQQGKNSYTPYLFTGVGYIDFDPRWTKWEEGKWDNKDIKNDLSSWSRRSISVPFGVGFKYNLRGPWTVGVEAGYRLTLTDYLDAVSGSEFFKDKLTSTNRLISGDGRPRDAYMTAGFTVSYMIFRGGCPKWRD